MSDKKSDHHSDDEEVIEDAEGESAERILNVPIKVIENGVKVQEFKMPDLDANLTGGQVKTKLLEQLGLSGVPTTDWNLSCHLYVLRPHLRKLIKDDDVLANFLVDLADRYSELELDVTRIQSPRVDFGLDSKKATT